MGVNLPDRIFTPDRDRRMRLAETEIDALWSAVRRLRRSRDKWKSRFYGALLCAVPMMVIASAITWEVCR